MRTLRLLAAALAGALIIAAGTAGRAHAALPPVEHVFVIVLENKDYEESFGAASEAPYLARTLTAQGQLLTQYFGTSHASLGNYISMISGQAPNPQTQGDCQLFVDVFPGVPVPDGQTLGQGCVYPAAIRTVADQLDAGGLAWKGYMQDMGNSPTEPRTCRHPAIGAPDSTQKARVGDQYAARHNPFVYFHSIIDDRARCDRSVVPLDQLAPDLASAGTTPSLSFISPNLCEDGHDEPCVDGRPGGLVSADAFLQTWVPRITQSQAYKNGGLLVITWDEGQISQKGSEACCDEPAGPNTPLPGIFGPGGGRTGAVVLSPWTRPGTTNGQAYNHYALLRSIEDIFGLGHLGYAGQPGLKPFGEDVFDAARATVDRPVKRRVASRKCRRRSTSAHRRSGGARRRHAKRTSRGCAKKSRSRGSARRRHRSSRRS
jgi:phosphatidylinositol-3-phosphatase